jgi:uncharacterized cupin superfamily protein
MKGYTLRAIDEMQSLHHGAVKLAGAELGVQTFGVQVLDLPSGFSDYPAHDHADDGQEEVYVVLRGQAEFEIDGERIAVDAGRMLRVEPASRRRVRPGRDGVRILAIGRPPGAAYERPEPFRLAVPA